MAVVAPNQDDIQINLTVNVESNDALNKLEQVKDAVDDTARSAQKPSGDFREMGRAMREMGQEFQVESAPIRSISWDLMLTGRSISIVNAAFGNNQSIKQFTSLMYAAAAVTRMFVMYYDAQRVKTETETGRGFKAGHNMKRENPYDFGYNYPTGKKNVQTKVAPEIAPENIGLRAAEVSLGSFRRRTQYRQDKPASRSDVSGQVRDSALTAMASGAVQAFTPTKAKRGSKTYQEGIFSDAGGAISTIGGLLSMIPGGQIPGLALMGAGGLAGLNQYAQGGIIQKNMPVMAHKGEAFVKEKDFHAVNQLLSTFSQPMKINQSSMQPQVKSPALNTTNNNSEDVRNFINIDMHTGNIGSNIDVQKMLKQMAQQMALESRRRTGK